MKRKNIQEQALSLRAMFFPNARTGLLTLLSVIGAGAGGFGAYGSLGALVHEFAPGRVVQVYLWLSLLVSSAIYGALYTVYRSIDRETAKRLQAEEERDKAMKMYEKAMVLQHKMAERVRESVCNGNGKPYDCQAKLQFVLGEAVRRYLTARLGGDRYSITVKSVVRGTHEAKADRRCLEAVFRDQSQDEKLRKHGEIEDLEHCYIFRRFESSSRKWVLVRDVAAVDEIDGRVIKQRGKARNYRSTIAFPVQMPTPELSQGPTATSRLFGFLSIDCPDPNGFDRLFDRLDEGKEPGLHGENFTEHDDMNLFFGLADAVATLLVLRARPLGPHGEEASL